MNIISSRRAGLVALLLIAVPAIALAQLYQYTDKGGNTVYADHPPQDRLSGQKQLREDGVYWSDQSTVRSPATRVASSDSARPVEEPKHKNYSRVSVILYMTDW
jgi:hypothetical protein